MAKVVNNSNQGSGGNVTHLSTTNFNDTIHAYEAHIKTFEGIVKGVKSATDALLQNWQGKGRNAFEKDCKQVQLNLQDISEIIIFFIKEKKNIKKEGFVMKMKLTETIDDFNFEKTKRNVNNYFIDLEELKWEQARVNAQKGLIANYDVLPEDKGQPYIAVGKDEFNLSAKEEKCEELKKHLSGFYWAKSILTDEEQQYIIEYFMNGKYEDEVVELLGFNDGNDRAFRKLKRRAIYKFAYVLNLVA